MSRRKNAIRLNPDASVFDATVTINFQSVDPTFLQHLRRLVKYIRSHGRAPGRNYRSPDGLNTGLWFEQCQANPHLLTYEQRALLLCIPGVRLCTGTVTSLPLGYRTATEKKLWDRVSAWADNEVYDAGTRQARHNAMRTRMAAHAS
jgi:hypothetical protein